MKINLVILTIFFCFSFVGCANPAKRSFTSEYGWTCFSDNVAKDINGSELKKVKIPGEKLNCVKIDLDRDTVRDFSVRPWEKDNFPEMPDL